MGDVKKKYSPMPETAFYILYFLQKEDHGYSVSKQTEELTNGEVLLPPGTMYGTLAKMEKDGLIRAVRQENKRKLYLITELGQEILDQEIRRIRRLYANSKGEKYAED